MSGVQRNIFKPYSVACHGGPLSSRMTPDMLAPRRGLICVIRRRDSEQAAAVVRVAALTQG